MTLLLIDTIASPNFWLWLVVSVFAVLLLTGSAGRRRASLIATLREFVQRNQGPPTDKKKPSTDNQDAGPTA